LWSVSFTYKNNFNIQQAFSEWDPAPLWQNPPTIAQRTKLFKYHEAQNTVKWGYQIKTISICLQIFLQIFTLCRIFSQLQHKKYIWPTTKHQVPRILIIINGNDCVSVSVSVPASSACSWITFTWRRKQYANYKRPEENVNLYNNFSVGPRDWGWALTLTVPARGHGHGARVLVRSNFHN